MKMFVRQASLLFLKLQIIVRLLYCSVYLLTMNLVMFHTEIATFIPRIIELLSDNSSGVRQASVNALSKFAENGKTTILCCAIC